MTLVEVLMAATIFSVIAVGLAGTFFSGIRLWQRISTVDTAGRFVLLDLQKLARDLRACLDIPLIGFQGSAAGFSFPSVEGVRVVRVTYLFDAQGRKLVRSAFVFDPSLDASGEEKLLSTAVVLEADELRFSYLDPQAQDAAEWLEAWSKEQGMFRALRVEGILKGEPFAKIIIIPQN